MSEREPPPSLEDLDARLKKAREGVERSAGGRTRQIGGLGAALEIAIEMVGTLAVAVGIGWLLDNWLATRPVFLVIFFFLGAAAGGLNVYRRAQRLAGGDTDAGGSGDASDRGHNG
ncbi:MAG: AtpZ/AtpI family protein [Alphaproteobacteria bacterium]